MEESDCSTNCQSGTYRPYKSPKYTTDSNNTTHLQRGENEGFSENRLLRINKYKNNLISGFYRNYKGTSPIFILSVMQKTVQNAQTQYISSHLIIP